MLVGLRLLIRRFRLLMSFWEDWHPPERFSYVTDTVSGHFGAPFLLPATSGMFGTWA